MTKEAFDTQLQALRSRIDEIDAELLDVLARRLDVSGRIWVLKRQQGRSVLDAERERQMIAARVAAAQPQGLPAEMVAPLFELILTNTRAIVSA